MSIKKVKTPAKMFTSDLNKLETMVVSTMTRISNIVGCSLGPGGRNVIIESDLPGIPNKNTKDGVTIFRALGSNDPYEHLIIEQTRDAAVRTVNEAGDGPQPLYSKILTPRGFVKMGDIKVGMDICGTNETIQKVLGVYPKGQKEIYKVILSDGREVECCPDHLWKVTFNHGTKYIKTTEQISQDFVKTLSDGSSAYKYYLPITKVDFIEIKEEMPLDPYLVGVLLGDGCLCDSGSIELSLGFKKKHIIDKLNLPIGVTKSVQLIEKTHSYRVKLHGIRQLVKSLGLANTKSNTKFIPKSYLYSSIKTRESLLQGLLDTDGYINSRGLFEFSTISDELAEDFMFLIRSLGKSIHYRKHTRKKDDNSYSMTPIHRIQELNGYKYGAKIVNIIKTNKFTEMQCIKVSNEDNLYITDNFVVTHNTTSSTIIAAALIKNLFNFCKNNPKYSPQKVTRTITNITEKTLLPKIRKASIKITNENKGLLENVATISANGDSEMAKAVIEAFDKVGYGASSHVTIQELSGPSCYKADLIEGFPINKGYEESIGKFHPAFINDQAHQRCLLDKPLFILFDGNITDMVQVHDILDNIGQNYINGNSEFKNVVIVAHKFGDQVLTSLSFNFPNPNTINVIPLATPMSPIINSQLAFLMDLSAFTGAKIFDMNNPLVDATPDDFGKHMEKIEIYRFRTTIVGDPEPVNVEVRAEQIKEQVKQAESAMEKELLEERLGKLTSGIAQLKIYGSSTGELKEKADRAEDAVCAVRAAITHGCVPGGCRVLIDLIIDYWTSKDPIIKNIIIPSLLEPFNKLLENAGYNSDEINKILLKLISDKKIVYDVENGEYGDPLKMGILDATLAVEQALKNAVSISMVMGTLGGICAYPRDNMLENQYARDEQNFQRNVDNPEYAKNEANEKW